MSETQETTQAAQPDTETTVDPLAGVSQEAGSAEGVEATEGTEATEATEAAQAATETTQEPEKQPGDRRFAKLTSRFSALRDENEKLRRDYEASQALLNAGKEGAAAPQIDIDAAVNERLAQREFDAKRLAVVQDGAKTFGKEDWQEKTEVLHSMGATQNATFMQALVELPNAAALVAHLADDPDELQVLLSKSPVSMAATMGRMAASMAITKTTADTARVVSNAPKPVKPVTATAVVRDQTIYDKNLTMKEFAALRAKQAPRRLGGAG